ncbi:MAG: N-acetylmuramoyl-L-alanine amidase [Thermanaerothrix sp.]|nr:N-acetylmuramoyl-L-alanine amidase [Thermanaerothrix sp.]
MSRRVSVSVFLSLFLVGFLCLALPRAEAREGGFMVLWNGESRKGDVPFRRQGSLTLVAADVMLSSLGLSWQPRSDGLVVSMGGRKLEFWANSPVARLNGSVVPMEHPVMGDGGHWWVEQKGALGIVNGFLKSAGMNGNLAFRGFSNGPAEVSAAPAPKESGKGPASKDSKGLRPASQGGEEVPQYVKSFRWGVQKGFVRAVLELGSLENVTVSQTQRGVQVSLPFGVPQSLIPPSPRQDVVSCSIISYGSSTTLTFKAANLPVRHFSLDSPVRLVLDFPDGSAAYQPAGDAADGGARVESSASSDDWGVEGKPSRDASSGNGGVADRPFISVERVFKGKDRPVVAVDPGHGGKDPGAMGNGLREKDINLQVALRLKEVLSAYGVDVRLTRQDDRYLKLSERTQLANQWKADLFLSLHCNSLPPGRHSRGVELYLMSLPTDRDAMRLALFENREIGDASSTNEGMDRKTQLLMQILGDMQQNQKIDVSTSFAEALFGSGKSSGLNMKRVAQAPFYVLKGAAMPAVLVEMGFISEPSDAALLRDPGFQGRMASALARGVVDYLKGGRR